MDNNLTVQGDSMLPKGLSIGDFRFAVGTRERKPTKAEIAEGAKPDVKISVPVRILEVMVNGSPKRPITDAAEFARAGKKLGTYGAASLGTMVQSVGAAIYSEIAVPILNKQSDDERAKISVPAILAPKARERKSKKLTFTVWQPTK